MIKADTAFSKTCRIFENVRRLSLKKHEIEFLPMARLIQDSSRLFRLLDRADPIQAEISRRLWVLKSSIVFTLLDFDDPALRVQNQVSELVEASESLPEAISLINSLKICVSDIVGAGRNPKRDWLVRMLGDLPLDEGDGIGVLTALSSGRPPGWPVESVGKLKELSHLLSPIGSRRDLKSSLFRAVLLPCSCSNVPQSLLSSLLYSGVTDRIEVLLYSGERFQVPKRLTPPKDDIFSGHLLESELESEIVPVQANGVSSTVDSWVNEAFWQGLHGAARSDSHELCPARYLLFCDGTGTFLPEDGRVMTLPSDVRVTNEGDLCMVRVEDVCEGDIVVLRSGDSGLLLDEASERILGRESSDTLFSKATEWKDALDALLVTHTNEEVAQAIRERGISVSAASIHQWAGPDVLGPGSENVFRELINLLAAKGKIRKTGADLKDYADFCWQSLQTLRGLHQKAGNLIRQDLFKALFHRYGDNEKGHHSLSDKERIHIDGDANAELLVIRVASVDGKTAYVLPSRLGKLDDLKGNKWLG